MKGIIPVNANIINKATINSLDHLEFKGVTITDVSYVGHILEYKEEETKVRMKLWETSGSIDVYFYHRNESEGNSSLNNFKYEG